MAQWSLSCLCRLSWKVRLLSLVFSWCPLPEERIHPPSTYSGPSKLVKLVGPGILLVEKGSDHMTACQPYRVRPLASRVFIRSLIGGNRRLLS